MKVCTDSCLFGAWIAEKIERKEIDPKRILDIGTGTGLLSLMIAQKTSAKTDAIEIDENSFQQTKENFMESQWNQNLQVFHGDIKNWILPEKYDLIISNPPFYENDLRSSNQNKNKAKHHDTLTLKELILSIKINLTNDGNFGVLLPFHRIQFFTNLAIQNDFFISDELLVKQTPNHPFFRGILFFGKQKKSFTSKELIIKNNEGNYTEEFNYLLKDYYL
ncbi:MAG: methyltransferase [Ginsengibacter sp.]